MCVENDYCVFNNCAPTEIDEASVACSHAWALACFFQNKCCVIKSDSIILREAVVRFGQKSTDEYSDSDSPPLN